MALLRQSFLFLNHTITKNANIIFGASAIRHLYSSTTLGLDNFIQQKERLKSQLSNIAPKFREKMKEYTADDSKNMVFTEDLKNMVHLVDSDDDITLVIKMMKKFNQQNKQLRFGNYVFGPVIMRMFYTLNKHEEAYQCFRAPELDGLFDQLMTYQILLDLLYENQRYNDVLDAFQFIKDKQIEGIKFAKNIIVLVFAACYRMNTKESLDFALGVWSELNTIGHLPMRRAATFCAGLALNQGKSEAALEIVSSTRNVNYTTVRNIKVSALVDLQRVEDAFPILKSVLNDDGATLGPVHTFNKDVFEKIKGAVVKLNNTDLTLEFNRIEKYFKEQGHISETTLHEQLCQEISSPPIIRNRPNTFFRQPQRFTQNESTGQYKIRRLIDRPHPLHREETPEATTSAFSDGHHTPEPIAETPEEIRVPGPSRPYKTPEEIRALPQAPPRKRQKTGRKPAKKKILTDTPNIAEIKSEYEKRQEQKNTAAKKNAKKNLTTDEILIGTINMKEIVKQKKEKAVEDESDLDNLAFYSSSSSEITDIEEQIEKEREEDFVIGMINVNDYVLVRFVTKKIERHYVGKILEKVEGGEYLINFMRRKKPGYHFVFADVEDQSMVSEDDIRKLPPPSFVSGTARSKKRLVFPIHFDKHNYVN
ncbi:hypothetical protein RN001_001835 [Aquatica leii]|uniref:Pentatricopeptide repeat-containing protein 2, mitochondrial n=1 Tax=Aquatica leii TaxID=1421715 RepID=A0AAN7PGD7_9COLE|nr:hypothetical protein RN001_001835 [Aquatica leii]